MKIPKPADSRKQNIKKTKYQHQTSSLRESCNTKHMFHIGICIVAFTGKCQRNTIKESSRASVVTSYQFFPRLCRSGGGFQPCKQFLDKGAVIFQHRNNLQENNRIKIENTILMPREV